VDAAAHDLAGGDRAAREGDRASDLGPRVVTGYFVTGTDTGVGKTHVAALLARSAVARGRKVFAFKPIETGCASGELGSDQQQLCAAAGAWQSGALRGCYALALPAAPRVAAAAEQLDIDLDRVVRTAGEGAAAASLTLVEGAGGWRVPITAREDMAALARRLGLPVLVVARATLGTINHSLLTVEAVARDGCSVAALVLSRLPEQDRAFAFENAAEITARWSGRVVVCEGQGSALDDLIG